MKYDYLIVGAGLFGSIFAYEANKLGKKVLVVDKRNHIGGNCYSEPFEDYHIHKYGPHIFHTSKKYVWDYINKFAEFNNFTLRNKAFVNNKIYSLPINLSTIHHVWNDVVTPLQAKERINSDKILFENPQNFEEYCLSTMGRTLYEMFFYGYTKKQWGREPKLLPASIAKRIPLRFSLNDRYYSDDHVYEGIPIHGYTSIFEKLLSGIVVWLECDYIVNRDFLNSLAEKVIYTGPIDQYFNYMFGDLEYRTLKHSSYNTKIDIQGTALMTYPSEDFHFTRIIQHNYFYNSKSDEKVITYEYSKTFDKNIPNEDPYYPINDEINNEKYEKYRNFASVNCPNLLIGGRLGNYKYFDMDTTIENALQVVKQEFAGNL
jgi:UDP-galactopyranose mutase